MEKQKTIVTMFDEIASTYDVANRVLSFGIDTRWRKKGCENALKLAGRNHLGLIVDVATGTGDMMTYWGRAAKELHVAVDRYVGIDPSEGMLAVARKKFPALEFVTASAADLPLADGSADMVSISYGIRNVVERRKAIGEFYRILAPGGALVILEFTKKHRTGLFGRVVDFYLDEVLPLIGGLISRNFRAYRYLPDSIDGFVTTESLSSELADAGFDVVSAESFSFEISTLIIAQKPA